MSCLLFLSLARYTQTQVHLRRSRKNCQRYTFILSSAEMEMIRCSLSVVSVYDTVSILLRPLGLSPKLNKAAGRDWRHMFFLSLRLRSEHDRKPRSTTPAEHGDVLSRTSLGATHLLDDLCRGPKTEQVCSFESLLMTRHPRIRSVV